MAHPRLLWVPLERRTLSSIALTGTEAIRAAAISYQSIRCAATKTTKQQQTKKKKKASNTFKQYDLKNAEQFPLLDAMRYIRAFEVGRNPSGSKYEVHVRLRTLKNGPVIRNRLRLPHAVKTDLRICVIAAPGSKAAAEARAAGASIVGEDDVINQIKEGIIDFERCICHTDSLQKMNKAALGRILGPKGLMPSTKTGTVVSNVGASVRDMVGASEYRERLGTIRMAVGQLGFTPEELHKNIKEFLDTIKKDINALKGGHSKEIHEVVISSTNAPGFTLNGDFRGPNSVQAKDLSGPL